MDEEKKAAHAASGPQPPFLELKDSIAIIFARFLETNRGEATMFQLRDPKNGGTYAILFVSCVRIDLTANTVIADACVLSWSASLFAMPVIDRAIRKMLVDIQATTLRSIHVITPPEEVKWWKAFLPTAVERCRSWNHQSKCEYMLQGVPRTVKMNEDPVCGCGRGKNLGGFDQVEGWKAFRPYVTRVALGMPFSTSLLSGITSDMQQTLRSELKRVSEMEREGAAGEFSEQCCTTCGGSGKPKLLLCSRCKGTQYCSTDCQKTDWKKHKLVCSK